MVAVGKFIFQFGLHLGGRWLQLTGGRCSEVVLVLKLLGRDLGWSLLTGGCYSEVVVSTGLTVHSNKIEIHTVRQLTPSNNLQLKKS